ncbi:MAG TPA: hypothetical protein VJ123_07475 [Anaerolineales bacterium]|nr:hypothetical protein [Anaerolineales bacterium]
MRPAVVVAAHNRPAALSRLLASLERAEYPSGSIPLLISIDPGGDPGVPHIAERFRWGHGEKLIIEHAQHLGLVEHFYRCGDLSEEYGALILLEEDLFVSPAFYSFASEALTFYGEDRRIAGISLYALWFNGYNQFPFVPLLDDADVYFLQVPYTQGQALTREQWSGFRSWQASGDRAIRVGDGLHEMFARFGPDEWFPLRMKYLVQTGRTYVFPRASLTTGFGDAGAHFARETRFFQVPLQGEAKDFRLKPLDDSCAVYDSFFEILPDRLNRLAPTLVGHTYDVDLYATKSPANLHADLVLTTRPCRLPSKGVGASPLRTFARAMWPMEANVIEGIFGVGIALARRDDLRWGRLSEWRIARRHYEYFSRGRRVGHSFSLKLSVAGLMDRLERRARV